MPAQAVEIFNLKFSHRLKDGTSDQWIRDKSLAIGRSYGVSSRAIRDIWNRKTWSFATQHLRPWKAVDLKHGVRYIPRDIFYYPVKPMDIEIMLIQGAWSTKRLPGLKVKTESSQQISNSQSKQSISGRPDWEPPQ